MVRAHIFISGLVQGVGFRHFTQRKAEGLGLTGWVRNLPDGRVEAIFESTTASDQEAKERAEKIIALCRKGPFGARVDRVDVDWEEATGEYKDFTIR